MRAQSALFTLFGDVVRPAGGHAWLTTLTACMDALGFSPEATRTALHRMAADGWVAPRRTGRYAAYRLTDRGVDRLEEAAARIYRLRTADWDRRWRLLTSPSIRRDPALAKALGWMGFGQLCADVWVSPHPHGSRLRAVLDEHGLDDVMRFVAEADGAGGRDRRIVETAWDLGRLHEAHHAFLDRWSDAEPPAQPRRAFETRVRLVHDWRSFLFLDPGLPLALLPDGWVGNQAAARFRELYEAVQTPAWTYYETLAAQAPANSSNSTEPKARPRPSPFERGLQALGA